MQTNQPIPKFSIVIPAYNECLRIVAALTELVTWIKEYAQPGEIIVVVQGTDSTYDLVENLSSKIECIKVIDQRNLSPGKGKAVRAGMLAASGNVVLFSDVDLSVSLKEVESMIERLEKDRTLDVLIATRRHPESVIKKHPPFRRKAASHVFNLMARSIGASKYTDTQCGLKAFKWLAAQSIFRKSKVDGFCFDVEILKIAQRDGWVTREYPVTWEWKGGTSVKICSASAEMAIDLLLIALEKR